MGRNIYPSHKALQLVRMRYRYKGEYLIGEGMKF